MKTNTNNQSLTHAGLFRSVKSKLCLGFSAAIYLAAATCQAIPFADLTGRWVAMPGPIACKIEQDGLNLRFSHPGAASNGNYVDQTHVNGWGSRGEVSEDGNTIKWPGGAVWYRQQ